MQTRVVVLSDAWELLKFLNDDAYAIDEKAGAKELRGDAVGVLDSACAALDTVTTWSTEAIEAALKAALIDGLDLKPRKAFGPIRVDVATPLNPTQFDSPVVVYVSLGQAF